ncbi:hypothetical protein BO71DRAFT_403440 [Aspergillus ellipticus CBS 707.79]|uniref:Zn(2)-C6 fungal-type domain-containing protein n=1 Tax=Aspergillus ellipticus CBS 707.79 TaxID=1448320 RepID=A0A319CUP3_9EURO|nr:hypothetical protein BO71DRAFT_403440 [Aspergillus ellipticus CBS 707.79]
MPSSAGELGSRLNKSGQQRQKRWSKRVQTGCVTCRIRHVKCDETKPSCRRCTSTGRKCDGYADPSTSADKRKKKQGSVQIVGYVHVAQMPSAWDSLGGEPVENESFHFFRLVTTSNLSGFFDFGFWSYRLLQVSHQYPALWHAMTALARLHRDFATDDTPMTVSRTRDSQKIVFALRQYNKSIRALRELLLRPYLTHVDKLAILSTCILYVGLAILQNFHWQAFQQIGNALKLFHLWNFGLQTDGNTDMNVLLALLTQLDSQARPHLLTKRPLIPWTDNRMILMPTSSPFRSLLEAYVALEVHFNNMIRLFTDMQTPPPDTPLPDHIKNALLIKQKCLDDFDEWDRRLASYLAIAPHEKDNNALDLLYLRRTFAQISLSLDATKGELASDDFLNEYTYMLHRAARILGAPSPSLAPAAILSHSQPPSRLFFCLTTTATEPLFFIATHCREPKIQQAALQLMKQYPRRESICEGPVAVSIAEALIGFEKRSCSTAAPGSCTTGQWICANHRVAKLHLFNPTDHEVHGQAWTAEDLATGSLGEKFVFHMW